MDNIQMLKALVNERLNAAAEEIFGFFESAVIKYEEEIGRQRRLLDIISKPEIKLCKDAALQLSVCKEEVSSEQQERSPSLDQEDPEPPLIKEEQEENWAGQEGEQQEEADIMKFIHPLTFTPVPVKSGNDGEENPQSSELNQTQMEENGKRDPLPSTSTTQMKTEPDGEYDWFLSSDCSGTGADDGGEWEESGGTQPGLNTLTSKRMTKGQHFSISKMFKKAVEHLDPTENFQLPLQAHRRTCNVCGERCTCNLDFQKHLNVSHAREKPFSCTVCGKQFAEKINLNGHMWKHMRKHTGEKSISCTVCGKQFAEKINLNGHMWKHMREHTGQKPISCTVCGKAFGKKGNLNVHMRTHTGEKPFSCTYCGKSFRTTTTLKVHMRTHTGEKPYSCTLCGQRFSQSNSLRIHMRRHTGEKPFSCTS